MQMSCFYVSGFIPGIWPALGPVIVKKQIDICLQCYGAIYHQYEDRHIKNWLQFVKVMGGNLVQIFRTTLIKSLQSIGQRA